MKIFMMKNLKNYFYEKFGNFMMKFLIFFIIQLLFFIETLVRNV